MEVVDGGKKRAIPMTSIDCGGADVVLAMAASPLSAFLGAAFWGLHMAFTQGLLSKLVAEQAPADLSVVGGDCSMSIEKKDRKKEEQNMCRIFIIYYSLHGHIFRMAEAVAEGVSQVAGCEALVRRVSETLPDEVLEKMGALEIQKRQAHIPVATVDDLAVADAIIFGTPTRFGNMCGQMRQFLDASGGI